jgi:hypothetical protein
MSGAVFTPIDGPVQAEMRKSARDAMERLFGGAFQ